MGHFLDLLRKNCSKRFLTEQGLLICFLKVMRDLVLLAVLENLVEVEVLVGHGLLEGPECLVLTVNPEPCDLVMLVMLVMRDLVLLAVLENLVEDELLVGHGLLDVPGSLVLLPLIVNPEPCDLVVELVELEVDGVLVVDGLREELVVHAVDGDVDEHI